MLYCKWSLELQVHNVYTRIQFNLYLYKDPNQGSHLYKDHINLYIYQCHIKILSWSFISFPPPNDKIFLEIYSYDQCLQDIFIFRNLMIHIVCRHYVHMTHVKFFQETDQMITRLYTVMCSSFRLQNIILFQGLSCLWQHNGARMIISLTWFHNYFHGICATLGATGSNRLFWSITQ